MKKLSALRNYSLAAFSLAAIAMTFGCTETTRQAAKLNQAKAQSGALSSGANSSQTPPKTSPAPSSKSTNAETVRIGSIDWYVKYEDALAEAKRSSRPIWLHFGENPG